MYDVSIVHCGSYQPEEVKNALAEAVEAVGGFGWLRPGMTVAIKANLVNAKDPDCAATTHPEVVAQMASLLLEKGASRVVVGDSPGGPFTAALLHRIYSATGMKLAQQAGAELNEDFSTEEVEFQDARVLKNFRYSSWLSRADAVVNLCKLKTHGLMGLTAAQKNLYGVVPGTTKAEYHYLHPRMMDFANLIVDLDEYVKPVLSVCDAVVGMEGNGPSSGSARFVGAILASLSPHLLDMAAAEVICLPAENVPTLMAAAERGLVPDALSMDQVFGDIEEFKLPDYQRITVPDSSIFSSVARGFFKKALSSGLELLFRPRPHLVGKCVGCGKCAEVCPAGAIKIREGRAVISRKKCIRCFCCQEFCPIGAMGVKRTAAAKLLNR